MIEDIELRILFRAESEEHLQTLENGLLLLEGEPENPAIIEDLFRSAHSLKGAARMLGVVELESLAHHFETELGAARHGRQVMSSEAADRLYQGLDAMRMLAREACGGESAGVDMPQVLAQLRGAEVPTLASEAIETSDPSSESELITRPSPTPSIPAETVEPHATELPGLAGAPPELLTTALGNAPLGSPDDDAASPPLATFKIETIRVEPLKLDALMTLAGEISITTSRVARSLAAIYDLRELWEEWNREAALAAGPKTDGQARKGESKKEDGRLKRLDRLLRRLETTGEEEIGRLRLVAEDLVDSIRDIRLLPLSTIFNLFPRLVRDLSHEQGKEVHLQMEGGAIKADKHLLEEIKDPLMHIIRNAVDHAVELPERRERQGKPREATIWLRATRTTTHMTIEVADDGRGLDEEAIRRSAIQKGLATETELSILSPKEVQRLIFLPAFTTAPLITDVSGRGVGLDVVRANIERLKGSVTIESKAGVGCTFRLRAPISLVTTRVMLVQVAQRSYALPIDSIQETFLIPRQQVFSIEGRPTILWNQRPVRVALLSEVLGVSPTQKAGSRQNDRMIGASSGSDWAGVLLNIESETIGLFVDALLDEQEVILKPFGGLLHRVRNVLGATTLTTGEICMVLNPDDLIKSLSKQTSFESLSQPKGEEHRKKLILVAEDSITTRTQEKRILEAAGYEVVVAVDGADAFAKLSSNTFDAVVSDIEMPKLTGLQLAEKIRLDSKYVDLPIILVTSLATDEDRRRGIEVGANAYITKGSFDQNLLLETLRKLV
jgi:two-component system chemotaxis sensor kinase CheA